MIKFNLGKLDWKLSGCHPWIWKLGKSMELGEELQGDIVDLPVTVPGSVQKALLDAGVIKDWNTGLNSLECEWIENRHWIFSTTIPADYFKAGTKFNLNFKGNFFLCFYEHIKMIVKYFYQHSPIIYEMHMEHGNKAFINGQYKKAAAGYARAIDTKPDEINAHYMKSMALYGSGDLKKAVRFFEHALKISPDPGIYYQLGIVFLETGNKEQAVSCWKEAHKIDPTLNSARCLIDRYSR